MVRLSTNYNNSVTDINNSFTPQLRVEQKLFVRSTLSKLVDERSLSTANWIFDAVIKELEGDAKEQGLQSLHSLLSLFSKKGEDPSLLEDLVKADPSASFQALKLFFNALLKNDKAKNKLKERLEKALDPVFFPKPSSMNGETKALLLGGLEAIVLYLSHMERALGGNDYSALSDPKLASRVHASMSAELAKLCPLSRQPLRVQLLELLKYKGADNLFVATILEKAIVTLSSPEMIAGFVLKAVKGDWKSSHLEAPQAPLADFDASDTVFSKNLNDLIARVASAASKVSIQSGVARFFGEKAINKLLDRFAGKIGEKTQQAVNRRLHSGFNFVPLLCIQNLLLGPIKSTLSQEQLRPAVRQAVHEKITELFRKHVVIGETFLNMLTETTITNVTTIALDENLAQLFIKYALHTTIERLNSRTEG